MLKRPLFYNVIKQIEHKNAIVIIGMRQVGKTVLMRQIFDHLSSDLSKLWFDFENPIDTKVFEDIDYRGIYVRLQTMANKKGRLHVFIDEIQNFPEITKIIKYLIDHFGVKFFVTGSSNYYLRNLFPESLSGRKFLHILSPLSFSEYLYFLGKLDVRSTDANRDVFSQPINIFKHKEIEADYEHYLLYGGFPEVATTSDRVIKQEILKNIFKSFFEKDLKILDHHRNIRELRNLLLLLVPRVGSMLDVNRLAGELQITRQKVYDYLEFLQGTFVVKLLGKYSKGADRAVAGGKKVYFADTGLLNMIGKVNDAQLLENAVVNQLTNYGELSFYNKRNTAEIDVILNKEIAFEIKTTGTVGDYEKLKKLADSLKLKKHFVVSKNYVNKNGFISAHQL